MHWPKRPGDKVKRKRAQGPKSSAGRPNPKAAGQHTLTFGKYKGKLIVEIGREDPSYLRWVAETFEDGTTRRLVRTYLGMDSGRQSKGRPAAPRSGSARTKGGSQPQLNARGVNPSIARARKMTDDELDGVCPY